MSTVLLEAVVLANDILRTTAVVELGTVYFVANLGVRFAADFSLKVLAIHQPNAIARAVASATAFDCAVSALVCT